MYEAEFIYIYEEMQDMMFTGGDCEDWCLLRPYHLYCVRNLPSFQGSCVFLSDYIASCLGT